MRSDVRFHFSVKKTKEDPVVIDLLCGKTELKFSYGAGGGRGRGGGGAGRRAIGPGGRPAPYTGEDDTSLVVRAAQRLRERTSFAAART